MSRQILDLASDLARRGEPFALATVVARKAPVSAQVGDMALVTQQGVLHGWVGGSCTRETVLMEAQKALLDGAPRYVVLDPDPASLNRSDVVIYPMTCHSGGKVEIHIQPVLPAPVVLVFGLSPTARALSRLAHAMGYTVHAVDPGADASAFPDATSVVTTAQQLNFAKTTSPVVGVVATQGQWDEDAVLAALSFEPEYLGVVASPKRFAQMRAMISGKASEEALGRIKNPAGLDLGARRPEEIAVSILAEIVKMRRQAQAHAPKEPVAPNPAEHRDPVCGMTVREAGARHTAEHDGRRFYFCCAGCRERFMADPKGYLETEARG